MDGMLYSVTTELRLKIFQIFFIELSGMKLVQPKPPEENGSPNLRSVNPKLLSRIISQQKITAANSNIKMKGFTPYMLRNNSYNCS